MKRARIVFIAALVTCASASAQQWTVVQSQHFELYTSGDPGAGRAAAVFFEQVHDLFAGWNAKDQKPAPRVKIIVFQSDEEYRQFQPNTLAAAFFMSGEAGDFIVTRSLTPETYPVAVHEYVHLVVKRSGIRITTAMNEGLAEFYSTLRVTPAGIEIGTPPVARLLTLRSAKLIPLDELFAVGTQSPLYRDRALAETFYAESWALTHMLLLSPEYRDKTTSYARDMQAGPDPVSALERISGKSGHQILSDLHHYVHRDRFVTALLDGKWDVHRAAPEARRATKYESGMVLADLLDSMGRHAEARARYSALAAGGPESRN
jgi:hypothetical protein